jgi:hypothetical protein
MCTGGRKKVNKKVTKAHVSHMYRETPSKRIQLNLALLDVLPTLLISQCFMLIGEGIDISRGSKIACSLKKATSSLTLHGTSVCACKNMRYF